MVFVIGADTTVLAKREMRTAETYFMMMRLFQDGGWILDFECS